MKDDNTFPSGPWRGYFVYKWSAYRHRPPASTISGRRVY